MWGWKPSITYNIAPIPWAKPSRNLHNSKIGARICMTGSLSHKSQSGQGVTCDNSQSQKRQLNTDLFGSQHWTKIELESIPRKWGPLPNLHEPNPTAHTAHYSTLGIMPSAKSFPRQPLSPINKVQVIQQHAGWLSTCLEVPQPSSWTVPVCPGATGKLSKRCLDQPPKT